MSPRMTLGRVVPNSVSALGGTIIKEGCEDIMPITETYQRKRSGRTVSGWRPDRPADRFAELESLYREADIGLGLLDRELRYLRINARLARINGCPVADHLGRTVGEVLPELAPRLEPIFRRILETGESIRDVEIEGSTPAEPGVVRYWCGSYYPLKDERGRPRAISMVVKENNDLKKRELELEIKRLRACVEQENVYLRDQVELEFRHDEIVGRSRGLREVLVQVEQVASTDSTVLLQGETGTGKELVARAIHRLSLRASRPMIKVNCAALPSALVESELFGRERGAYTGALSRQTGRFEIADRSTIFLDEIGELAIELQAKLLRVLQDGEFERLGSTRTIKVNTRVIAATNRDLNEAVRKGTFREDLFYRLNVFPITVPPLRERRDDILPLVWLFLKQFGRSLGSPIETIPRKVVDKLLAYAWPGNVRELRNVLERAMICSRGGQPFRVDLSSSSETASLLGLTLDEVQRRHIVRVLEQTGWKVRGNNGAAALLDMKPTTLEGRMAKFGVRRPAPFSRIS